MIPARFWMAAATALIASPVCYAHDYPTSDRVEFVLECMRDHEGGEFELRTKCSCVIDRLAEQFSYDDFVEAQTAAKAITIAGERSAILRDNEETQKLARSYRDAYKKAAQACFLK